MYHRYSTIFSKDPDPADEKLFGPEKLRKSVNQNAMKTKKKVSTAFADHNAIKEKVFTAI